MNGRIQRNEPAATMVLPRIGKIKIGKKSEKGYPMSVDYFIPSGKYAGLFTQAYGEKPQTIQIVFPSDDAEQVCNERYEYRDDEGRLIASGDLIPTKVSDWKTVAEEIYTKQGRYTLKTVIYE